MLDDVVKAVKPHGLELHPAKTKILGNLTRRTGRSSSRTTRVQDMDIEILPHSGSLKYLGQLITFQDPMGTEIQHRTRAAWAAFTTHKDELTNKCYPLADRLRLFDSTVTPTALYGAETWTLTEPRRQQLRRTQRRMLRMIIRTPRRRNTDPAHLQNNRGTHAEDFSDESPADITHPTKHNLDQVDGNLLQRNTPSAPDRRREASDHE